MEVCRRLSVYGYMLYAKGDTLADPNGFYNLLARSPYHGDTLLQMSDVFSHREGTTSLPSPSPKPNLFNTIVHIEYNQAADFIERALFAFESAFAGSFSFTSGIHRLDFDYVDNRPFFLAVHKYIM